MKTTASDVFVETLLAWGVDTIFGLPGDGINGVIEALRKNQDKIRFIHVRHEESAAFMACAYAKYTGKLGVCLSTSGPGGLHLINGLYDAKLDGAPVLAITGMQFHDLVCTHTQQDVELDKVFQDVCVYNARVMGPAHVENVVDLACRTALAYRGVSHVTIPVDFQDKEVERKNFSKRNLPHHHYATHTLSSERAQDLDLQKAAEILNAGKKVFILVGQGAHDAREEVSQIAELLEAPVAKALLGKTVIPDDHPYSVGGVGLLGTLPAETAIEECDTLLMVGTSFPYIEFYPKIGQARCVQIDINPTRLNLRYPAEATLVGDSAQVLNQLLPLLKKKSDRGFIESAQAGMKKWRERLHVEATRDSLPMKPQVVASVLGKMIDDNAVVSCDSGTNTTWWARHVPAKAGQLHSVSGTLASMACALPYAIAAAVAYPDRQSICFVGDGGFSMLMAELSTIVKYKLNVKIVVIKNNTLGQIKWEQMVFLGNPEYQCELENIDYAGVATACGVKGFTLDHPKDAERIVREALSHPGPALIDAVVDPLEAPMPAKITVEQALKFSEAVLRGQPQGLKIMKTLGLDRLKEVI